MDNYQASQTLASDLLQTVDSDVFQHASAQHPTAYEDGPPNVLNDPELWSELESEASSEHVLEEDEDVLQDNFAQLRADHRDAMTFRRRGKAPGTQKRKKRSAAQPSFQIQGLLGQANQLYADGDLAEALTLVEEIIRLDGTTYSAFILLGEIHKDRDSLDKCLTAWMTAAHLRQKYGPIWSSCAKLSQELGYVEQTMFCYKMLVAAEPDNGNALWDRAMFCMNHGAQDKAIASFRQLLNVLPHNMVVIRHLTRLLYEVGRTDEALKIYKDTSEYYITSNLRKDFDWDELNIMSELYQTAAEASGRTEIWRTLISSLKTVARWLLNRQYETFWDDRDDDAEYDIDHTRRRTEPRFVTPDDSRPYELPPDLRIKLGKARLFLNQKDEAMRHFGMLPTTNLEEFADLYVEVGNALLNNKCWVEALEVYIKLTESDLEYGPELWRSMAKAFKETQDYEQAEECMLSIIRAEPRDTETMVALAEVYELQDRREDALQVINQVILIRQPTEDIDGRTEDDYFTEVGIDDDRGFFLNNRETGKGRRKHSKKLGKELKRPTRRTEDLLLHEERKTQETVQRFRALELACEFMMAGDSESLAEYMLHASELVDDFRGIKHFYPSEKKTIFKGLVRSNRKPSALSDTDLRGMANRLEESLVGDQAVSKDIARLDSFRGAQFITWHKTFIQYALQLALGGETHEAFNVLESAQSANVFYHNPEFIESLNVFHLLLAIRIQDCRVVESAGRHLIQNHNFSADGYRTLSVGLSSGQQAFQQFGDPKLQKFLLRMIKYMDKTLLDDHIIEHDTTNTQNSRVCADTKEVLPTLHMLYGFLLLSSRSYTPAMHYFGKAYSHSKVDPLVLFSIGLSYLHKSMQRQSDNRHLQIMQALTFLFKYHDIRQSTGQPGLEQEANYNIARAFHQLGLAHIAIRYYEKALHGPSVDPVFDLSWNVAYNLQQLYILAGATAKAKTITAQYLSI